MPEPPTGGSEEGEFLHRIRPGLERRVERRAEAGQFHDPPHRRLLAVRRWCLQRGIALRLRDVQPSVWRVVELAGLGAAFDASAEPGPDPVQELALF